MSMLFGCVYERGASRCEAKPVPGRGLCAEHITAVCCCGRQAVRECGEWVGSKVCGRPSCTRCGCPVHTGTAEPRVLIYAR